eukprot:TRINITY_DN1503_c0_g1_i8.p1 TRINITY_DN1503_c0_g1~~TRINITY_DN1503_c0_g1_i8.p1  ORF type:complete len:473 (-),score=88.61 TRINITY_DN1503_c0_g1_i8:724-2142(-)
MLAAQLPEHTAAERRRRRVWSATSVCSYFQPPRGVPAPAVEPPRVRLYKRRWVMLAFLCLVSTTNSTMSLCFTPMAKETAAHYHVRIAFVNALVAMGDALSLISVFVLPYFVDQRGIFVSTVIMHALNVGGAWLRFVGFPGKAGFFVPLFIGQATCIIAMFFCTQVSPRLAATWFPPSQRTVAVALQTVFWMGGLILGIVLGSVLKKYIWILLLVQAIINTLPALGIFFTRNKPPKPPVQTEGQSEPGSENETREEGTPTGKRHWWFVRWKHSAKSKPTQAAEEDVQPRSARGRCKRLCCCGGRSDSSNRSLKTELHELLHAMRVMLTNKFFVPLILSNGVPQGVCSVTLTLIQQLVPEKMAKYAAIFSGLFIGSGIFGSLLLSALAGRTHWYYAICSVCLTVTCVTFTVFYLAIIFEQIALAIIFFTITGARKGNASLLLLCPTLSLQVFSSLAHFPYPRTMLLRCHSFAE